MPLDTFNCFVIFGFLALVTPPAFSSPDAKEIISRSDEVRNPKKPFRARNTLTAWLQGKPRDKEPTQLMVYSKEEPKTGQFKNVVRYLEPRRDAGKMVLMNGTEMWFYDPSSSAGASVKISPQQRLLGQASQGDVVTVNLARDYNARVLGTETLKDADQKERTCWHLELLPAKPDSIYGKIEYWVEEKTFKPVKGKFFADSQRLLKISYYHKYEIQLGQERPGEVIIIDGVNPKEVTTMEFSEYAFQDLPDSWFQREMLPKIKFELSK